MSLTHVLRDIFNNGTHCNESLKTTPIRKKKSLKNGEEVEHRQCFMYYSNALTENNLKLKFIAENYLKLFCKGKKR